MPEDNQADHPSKALTKPEHHGDLQNKATDKSRASIMGATTNVLNFFALVVLVVESIIALLVGVTSGLGKFPATEIPHMIYLMVGILGTIVLIVSGLAVFRPEVLSAESSKMQREIEESRLAAELAQRKADKVESLVADDVLLQVMRESLIADDTFRETVEEIVEAALKQNTERPRSKRRTIPKLPSHPESNEEEEDE